MNIINALILSSLAGLSTVIGALVIFLPTNKTNTNIFINFSLSFSCSVMIGISIFDLIPEGVRYIIEKQSVIIIITYLLISFIFSFILLKIINIFLRKYEDNLYKLGVLSMIILIIHNFPEGIITFLSSVYNIKLGIKISLAIALHNIPEGLAIAVPIYTSTKSRSKAIIMAVLSGIAEPIGAIFAYLFISKYMTSQILAIILIFVGFLMINLAIEEIFPRINKKGSVKQIYIGFIIGLITVLINILL